MRKKSILITILTLVLALNACSLFGPCDPDLMNAQARGNDHMGFHSVLGK